MKPRDFSGSPGGTGPTNDSFKTVANHIGNLIVLPPKHMPSQYPTTKRCNVLKPHPGQHDLWFSPARFPICHSGRRSGKTEIAKRRLVMRAMDPWNVNMPFPAISDDPRCRYHVMKSLEAVDAAEVIQDVVKTVKPMLDANHHKLDLDIAPGLPQVRADKGILKQMLLNLLSNDIKYTASGGKIRVEAVLNGNWFQASVIDNGVGISKEDQERLFQAFSQAELPSTMKREGTGLGLVLTKRFVELCGGKIWVNSKVGMGSRFTFSLPIATSDD